LKKRPDGFDPFVEQHYRKDEELKYGKWKEYTGQEQIDERSVFPNEIVIDIDEGGTEERRKETKKVLTYLDQHGFDYIVADTGGTGFHIHLFFQYKGIDLSQYREVRIALYEYLKEEARKEVDANVEAWDDQPVYFDADKSKGHLVRALGGRKKESEKRKTEVLASQLEKEEVDDLENVEYPGRIPWSIEISKTDTDNAHLSIQEIQEKVEEVQEEERERFNEELEAEYSAEGTGLKAVRDVDASQALKVIGVDAPQDQNFECPFHDDSSPSANLHTKEGTERLYCFADACVEEGGRTPRVRNAVDILVESGEYSFKEAVDKLSDKFDIEVDLETTEVTEGAETTEPGSFLDSYLDTEQPSKVRLSGHLDDETYFHTVFLEKNGETEKAVITSDREIYKVRNKLDELEQDGEEFEGDKQKFDYEYFEVDNQQYRFKHKATKFPELDIYTADNQVLRFLRDKHPDEEVYNKVRQTIKRYWDHYNEEWFDIATAWTIHTYLVNGIGYTAYLMLKGKEDTGKTTLQKILARLSYNGFFSGKSTPAVTSRVAHFSQASLHLDEFEKTANDEVQGVFNTGQRKGAKYSFTNMNKDKVEDQITALHSFCPKTLSVNTLYEFDNHFLSRNIILEATRTTRSLEKIENIGVAKEKEIQSLRNELLAYSLFNHEQLLTEIEEYRESLEESGREADKVGLISGIVKHFKGKEKASEIAEFLSNKKELQEEQINQRLQVLFERIIQEFGDEDQEIRIKPKALANHVNRELKVEDEYELSSRGVGNRLRNYDILRDSSQSSRSGSQGETVYTIPRDYLVDSFTRYDLLNLREKLTSKGKEVGSVASASSVSSVNDGGKSVRNQIVDAMVELEAVGRNGVPTNYIDLYDELDVEQGVDDYIDQMKDKGEIVETPDGKIYLTEKAPVQEVED